MEYLLKIIDSKGRIRIPNKVLESEELEIGSLVQLEFFRDDKLISADYNFIDSKQRFQTSRLIREYFSLSNKEHFLADVFSLQQPIFFVDYVLFRPSEDGRLYLPRGVKKALGIQPKNLFQISQISSDDLSLDSFLLENYDAVIDNQNRMTILDIGHNHPLKKQEYFTAKVTYKSIQP